MTLAQLISLLLILGGVFGILKLGRTDAAAPEESEAA
jgi:hypothetical protein